MAIRRRLNGTPLLLATGAMVLACGGGADSIPQYGNLMPPPQAEVCVDTVPEDAKVMLNGVEAPDRCTTIYDYQVAVKVSAPDHMSQEEVHLLSGEKLDLAIELGPAPIPPPVGNLMPPPRK